MTKEKVHPGSQVLQETLQDTPSVKSSVAQTLGQQKRMAHSEWYKRVTKKPASLEEWV
jgi:hypothetical protein